MKSLFSLKSEKREIAEYGRSMIEMLGVLAIIGVITIVGIFGYRFSLVKKEVNDIVSEINMRLSVVDTQIQSDRQVNLDEFKGTIKTYPVGYEYDKENGVFSIMLRNVPQRICHALIKVIWNRPVEVRLNERHVTQNAMCSLEPNEVEFVFVDDLFYKESSLCEYDDEYHKNGTCLTDNFCKEPNTFKSGMDAGSPICVSCPYEEQPIVEITGGEDNTCNKCYNAFNFENKKCVYCPYPMRACGDKCCATSCEYVNNDYYCGGCVSSDECPKNSYCHFNTVDSCNFTPPAGECRSINAYINKFGDKKFFRSATKMDWWSAQDYCKGLGENVRSATRLDLECYSYNNGDVGYCCADTTGDCYWFDGTAYTKPKNMSSFMLEMRGYFTDTDRAYWLADTASAKEGRCTAYHIYFHSGYLGVQFRDLQDNFALCVDEDVW